MNDVVVCDSSPLIALEPIGQLALIDRLYGGIVVPPAVAREIAPSVHMRDWVQVRSLSLPVPAGIQRAHLDSGETEAISPAVELDPSWIVIDEKRGRRVAEELGLHVVGTLGILRSAKIIGVLDSVLPLVEALRSVSFFIDERLIRRILVELDEGDERNVTLRYHRARRRRQ